MTALQEISGTIARIVLTGLDRRRLPKIEGQLTVPGLQSLAEVIRDRWGIPHIYATNPHDLFFVQGFVHAQDRLWQMELNRRSATGRLSELFGELTLGADIAIRSMGMNRLGMADWENADVDLREIVLAYVAGINAFLEHTSARMPVEFTLLNHSPEPWKPVEVMAIMRLLAWQLTFGWYGEIMRARIIETVGPEPAAELELHYPKDNPITLPKGIEFNRIDPEDVLYGAGGHFPAQGMGSNAWVLSGSKTTTGKPILASDPHLLLTTPSIWYQTHLIAEKLNVHGVSIPGMPTVIIGHNTHLAWGITLAWTDSQDLFIEKMDPQISSRYEFRGKWREAEILEEVIQVNGCSQPHIERVVQTHHGPIVSGVVGYPEQRIALSSMALQRGSNNLKGWLLLNQASCWDDFVKSMQYIEGPALNIVYADINGNIGYWVTGKVPVRARGEGMIPSPGWTGEYEWVGDVPFEEMPHALNPEQGYIVTCNHRIVPDGYPFFLGNVWNNGYRAQRLVEVLDSKDKLSTGDCQELQMDFTSLPGLEFVKCLDGLSSQDPKLQAALHHLRSWDGKLSALTVAGTLYQVMRYFLFRNLLEPGLGKEMVTHMMGQGFHPLVYPMMEYWSQDIAILLRLLNNPNSWWIAQAGGREAILTRSLLQTVDYLKEKLGPNMKTWEWGRLHQINFPHAIGAQKPLNQVFNRGLQPVGGDADTLFLTAVVPGDAEDNIRVFAPSYRQIVDLGDPTHSMAVQPPGQSGHLASPHYDDMIDLYMQGKYYPKLWRREQIEANAEGKLNLLP